jgi:hypothetical protein
LTRRNRQPFWLKSIRDRINGWYVNHFIRPEFDAAGYDLRVMTPRSLDISGPNIRVGDHVHFMALPDKPVRLAVFEGLGKINIGSYSIINPGVRITSADEINIGEGCMLATNCYLSTEFTHPANTRPLILQTMFGSVMGHWSQKASVLARTALSGQIPLSQRMCQTTVLSPGTLHARCGNSVTNTLLPGATYSICIGITTNSRLSIFANCYRGTPSAIGCVHSCGQTIRTSRPGHSIVPGTL